MANLRMGVDLLTVIVVIASIKRHIGGGPGSLTHLHDGCMAQAEDAQHQSRQQDE